MLLCQVRGLGSVLSQSLSHTLSQSLTQSPLSVNASNNLPLLVRPGTDKMAGAARDNAISALGKVAEAYESKLERDWITTWRHFFHSLPLTSDYLEAHVVYALVCRLLMRRDTSVIGISSTQDIIHIATVLCTQLGTSFMTDEVTAMVVIVLSQVSKNVHDGVWNKLSDKQKIRVSAAINNHTNNKK